MAWRDLPERSGPWQTVWKRHRRFSRDGTWDRILAAVLAEADAAGDIDCAVSVDSTTNRAHQHAATLPRITGGRRESHESRARAPDALLADKAYFSRAIRSELRRRGIVAVIPEPRDQQGHRKRRGSRGGRPVTYDPALHKSRNVVERAFCLLKQWRGLATRYDKHALTYRGAVVLAAIIAWLRP